MKFNGIMNPVTCAAYLLESVQQPFDKDSFDRVAAIVGDKGNEENGFVVTEASQVTEALIKLCEIGNFVITCNNVGILVAMLPEEFEAIKQEY